jgi:hypothetical protein
MRPKDRNPFEKILCRKKFLTSSKGDYIDRTSFYLVETEFQIIIQIKRFLENFKVVFGVDDSV